MTEYDEIRIDEDENVDEITISEDNKEEISIVSDNVIYKSDKNYLHIQNTASNTWQINHNLNKYPSVTVIDSAGNEVIGDVEYINVNNLIITFKGSFKGKATLN